MRRKFLLSLTALLTTLFGSDADAQQIGMLACTFGQGVVTELTAAPQTIESEDAPLLIVLTNIDLNAGRATIIGNADASGVQVVAIRGTHGMSFVEVTPAGNVTTTTVFSSEGSLRAVHSRHIAFGGPQIVTQLFGSCRQS